jgi:hypothetical protein
VGRTNGAEHRFSDEKKIVEWDWVVEFKNIDSDICLRKPEAISSVHAMAFNKPEVTQFFDLKRL